MRHYKKFPVLNTRIKESFGGQKTNKKRTRKETWKNKKKNETENSDTKNRCEAKQDFVVSVMLFEFNHLVA